MRIFNIQIFFEETGVRMCRDQFAFPLSGSTRIALLPIMRCSFGMTKQTLNWSSPTSIRCQQEIWRFVRLPASASWLADKPPDGWQRLFKTRAPLGDRFFSPVKFHEAYVAQTRSKHNVRWPAGQSGAGDVVLHNIDRVR